ncbi:hypothetical protein [uncultured Arthrobacter sp.]|uniref:hypothetical protein n=1 Tax=uncultured Arthrobacter sp. TaxID=114050 RepID=UPI0025FF47E7|nr:hypothetical protein [uncultured Arthrobacter sp.]
MTAANLTTAAGALWPVLAVVAALVVLACLLVAAGERRLDRVVEDVLGPEVPDYDANVNARWVE